MAKENSSMIIEEGVEIKHTLRRRLRNKNSCNGKFK